MMLRSGLCALLLGTLCMSGSAIAASPKAQAASQDGSLGAAPQQKQPVRAQEQPTPAQEQPGGLQEQPKRSQQPPTRTQDRDGALSASPAPEVVHLKCPANLTYQAAGHAKSDPELAGWGESPVKPGNIEVSLRFQEIPDLHPGVWKGASSIECRYGGEVQDAHYRTTLTRRIHVSGTPYRCKLKKDYAPEVECRLSITPF